VGVSKPLLKSGREDVRALDELFVAMDKNMHWQMRCFVIRFYCESQGIKPEHVWPERFK
jgi:hypothetical protein